MEEILRKLVSFHTINDDPQSIHEAMDYIATFVAQRGMSVERFEYEGHEALIATIQPNEKTPKVMLAAHIDVIPGDDELFNLRVTEDKLYGRGTLDMKFAVAAYLQLIDDLQDNLDDYDFALLITSDEEIGGQSTRQILEEGYLPQVCVIPDGGDNWQIQVSSKGFYYLKMHRYGIPAHGSRPWLGDNAILPLMRALDNIQHIFSEPSPESPTLNIGTITGGASINQVADYAEASLDIRAKTEEEKRPLLARIEAICEQEDIELSIILDGIATHFDLDHPLVAPFAAAIHDVTGISVEGSHTLGSNDTRFYMAYDIPCISLYPTGTGHHGPEEWIDRQGFGQFKEVLDRYIQAIAKKQHPRAH